MPNSVAMQCNRRLDRSARLGRHQTLAAADAWIQFPPGRPNLFAAKCWTCGRLAAKAANNHVAGDTGNIHQLIEARAPMTVEQRLQPGRQVRVKSGAFKGLEGVVIERRGQNRLLVVVHYIQQGISMAIEDFMVEPL